MLNCEAFWIVLMTLMSITHLALFLICNQEVKEPKDFESGKF